MTKKKSAVEDGATTPAEAPITPPEPGESKTVEVEVEMTGKADGEVETEVVSITEPQPTDENGELIAPPADDGSEVEYTGSGENPESDVDEDAEVVDGEVVASGVGVTQTPDQDPGETFAVGETVPQVLSSGDELPAHRQRVESGEATTE